MDSLPKRPPRTEYLQRYYTVQYRASWCGLLDIDTKLFEC
eukprot:SAG22_NODE_865_length_6783_cov_23.880461_7_plen_40_part_00